MTIASMTGFAREAGTIGSLSFVWELRSVNARALDIKLRVPAGFEDIGDEARKRLGQAVKRGTCHIALAVTRGPRPAQIKINNELLDELIALSARYAGREGIALPSLDGLLGVKGVVDLVEATDTPQEEEAYREAILVGLERVIAAFSASRFQEGQVLATLLAGRLETIAQLVAKADAAPSRQPDTIRQKLEQSIATIMGAVPQLDPQRLYQEAVLIATRGDIREELDRLNAHVESASLLLAQGDAIGRRLDFLAQELGREANTLNAKSGDPALTSIALDLKTVVEQFREQVQNIE